MSATAGALRFGIVVAARGDTPLLDATLRSIAALPSPAEKVALMVSKGREHALADLASAIQGFTVVPLEARDNSWIQAGLGVVSQDVDVALMVTEGTLLGPASMQAMRDQFANWQDVVASAAIVNRAAYVTAGTPTRDIAALLNAPEPASLPWLRRWLRARSRMPCLLALRVSACANVRPPQLPEGFDWMSFALMLDALEPRGRTRVAFARDSRNLRFMPERRGRAVSSYALYARLSQLYQLADGDPSRRGGSRSAISARREKLRLLFDQMLQMLSPSRRPRVFADLKEMWRARRDARATRRSVARDLRDMR